MLDWRDKYDPIMLEFLERIKPAARNRGIICHIGNGKGVFFRDVVISDKKAEWSVPDYTSAHAIAAAYRPGWEMSPQPFLSILHLGGTETFDFDSRAVFILSNLDSFSTEAWKTRTVGQVEQYDQAGYTGVRSHILNMKLHPFSKKTKAYDLRGSWPLAKPFKWVQLGARGEADGIGEAYDIWAIPGSKEHEIDVYTAAGDAVRSYTGGRWKYKV